METQQKDAASAGSGLSCVSSLKDDGTRPYVQPHYRESYRLAIYALLCGGKEAYEELLRAEQISHFLSEEEIRFILGNAESPAVEDEPEGKRVADEPGPSTYFPMESDEEVPDLELGWPGVDPGHADTSISLLFHPPRRDTPTIKEVLRSHIQHARQVIAIAMDVFTDVDIFKEVVRATLRGVVVYILLDDSRFHSFHVMSQRVGVRIQDLKNMRVRTVQGQLYQCQSGMKFHGGLEQKFMLVDCSTVLYGTYSYTWTYEKINLSMVLVVTGQLLWSYDEEFRRLFARSTVPAVLSQDGPSVQYLRNTVETQRTSSSRLSLDQISRRSGVMLGMRTAQDDNGAIMTRGLSVQEKLHQSHCADMSLVRGYSCGGGLQKLNSVTRLKMGTKGIGSPSPPQRTEANMRGGGDLLGARRMPQQIRHLKRYGADHNMVPFNSEMSLHRWKMDAYFNENNMPVEASYDAVLPMTSPYNSHTGLNEYQALHSRSREIQSRMDEKRQKRLSLQEFVHLRKSQESLRSMHSTLDRTKYMSSLRSLDMRSVAESEPNAHSGCSLDATGHQAPKKESNRRQPTPSRGHPSASHHDDRTTPQACDRHEPPPMTPAADLDNKLKDPLLKLSHLQSSNLSLQHPRAMESLTEVPEEKESSNTHGIGPDSVARYGTNEEVRKHEKSVSKENSMKSSLPAEPWHEDQTKGTSLAEVTNSLGSAALRERNKSEPSDTEKILKIQNTSQPAVEAKSSHPEKQQEPPTLQRKNSMRMKVQSLFSADEKKASKKEEKSLQRKASFKSQNPSGSAQTQASANGLQNCSSSPADADKYKSPFTRLSSFRSSKKRTDLSAEQDRGSRSSLDSEGTTRSATEKPYSRYEFMLSRDRSSSLRRHDPGCQAQTDKKLGRFMQRVGNLIGKNK